MGVDVIPGGACRDTDGAISSSCVLENVCMAFVLSVKVQIYGYSHETDPLLAC